MEKKWKYGIILVLSMSVSIVFSFFMRERQQETYERFLTETEPEDSPASEPSPEKANDTSLEKEDSQKNAMEKTREKKNVPNFGTQAPSGTEDPAENKDHTEDVPAYEWIRQTSVTESMQQNEAKADWDFYHPGKLEIGDMTEELLQKIDHDEDGLSKALFEYAEKSGTLDGATRAALIQYDLAVPDKIIMRFVLNNYDVTELLVTYENKRFTVS